MRLLQLLRERGEQCELDRQLEYESQSLQILMRQSQEWRELERVITPDIMELRRGNRATRKAVEEMSELRSRLWVQSSKYRVQLFQRSAPDSIFPYLCYGGALHADVVALIEDLIALQWCSAQMSYSKWWMTIRNVWYIYRLPSPLVVPGMQVEWLEGLNLAAQASVDMVTRCLKEEWDLGVFPRALGVALVLSFHTLSMGALHLRHYHPELSPPSFLGPSTMDSLDRLQNILKNSAVSLRTMLTRAQVTLDEYKRQLVNQSHRGSDRGTDTGADTTSEDAANSRQHPRMEDQQQPTLNPFDLGGLPISFSQGAGDSTLDMAEGGMGMFDPFQLHSGFGGGTGPAGMGFWDPLMGYNDAFDWHQPDHSGRPFWDR